MPVGGHLKPRKSGPTWSEHVVVVSVQEKDDGGGRCGESPLWARFPSSCGRVCASIGALSVHGLFGVGVGRGVA